MGQGLSGIDVKAVSEAINKNILDVVTASTIDERNQPQKHPHIGIVDFDQRAVYLADDSDAYRLELCIANLTDGTKIAYVKRYIEKASEEIAQKIKKAETAGQTRLKRPSENTISQDGENVKYSLSDSDGKQLEKAVSKALDDIYKGWK